MLKLAKHAVALIVVVAAAGAPVAAQADSVSFSYTRVVLTNSVQSVDGPIAVQPR